MRAINFKTLNDFFKRGASLVCAVIFSFGIIGQSRAQPASSTLSVTTTAKAPPSTTKKLSVKWNLSLSGDRFANEREQAQTAGFGVGAKIQYRLIEPLNFRASVGMVMQSGYVQSRFGDNAPRSGFDLREAVLQYRPAPVFSFEVGALDQGVLKLPLLVAQRPFPGAAEKILIGDKRLGAELRAQQTVPTSTTLATKAVEAEPMPSFLSETLKLSAMPNESITLRTYGTHWVFNQLPMRVALDSSPFGNTLDDGANQFRYEFQGFAAGGGATVDFTRKFAWNFDGGVIKNTDAPEDVGLAQHLATSFDLSLPGEVMLRPQGELFFAESDVAPAFYNDSSYGHSNRQGWAGELSANFKRAGFKASARYVNADVISRTLVQSTQQYFMIRFETLYDSLL